MWGPVPLVSLKSMSPHVALEGQGISKILATGGTGEKTSFEVLLVVDRGPWVMVATPTLLTSKGVGGTVSLLTVLVSRWMEQFSMPRQFWEVRKVALTVRATE